jgi:hypothetical protein
MITKARKNKHKFGVLRVLKIFNVCLTEFITNIQFLHNKISHRFLLTTKLFIYWV